MSDKHYVGLDVTGFEDHGELKPVSRVTLMLDDEKALTAGDDTGYEVLASCPHGTQEMVDALLTKLRGKVYRMYTADEAGLDPAAELGDGVTVGGLYSMISRLSDDGEGYPSISAPGEEELEDEYPSGGPMTREFNRQLAATRSSITKTADEIRLEVKNEVDGLSSSFTVQLDNIRSEVSEANGNASTALQTANSFETRITSAENSASTALQTANSFSAEIKDAQASAKAAIDTVNGLTFEVTNSGTTSSLRLKSGSTMLTSADIKITGFVTFTDLSTKGKTTINGDNITTGQISAEHIDTSTIKLETVYGKDRNNKALYTDSDNIYIGGDGTFNYKNVLLYAYTSVTITQFGGSGSLVISPSSNVIYSDYLWDLGKSTEPFNKIYCNKLYVNGKEITGSQTTTTTVSELVYGSYKVQLTSVSLTPSSSTISLGSSSTYWKELYASKIHLTSNCSFEGYAGDIKVDGNLRPVSTSDTLGTSSNYWATAYITKLYLSSTCYVTAGSSSSIKVGTTTIGGSSGSSSVSKLTSGSYNVELSSTTLKPSSTSFNLGSSSNYWSYVHAQNVRLYYNGSTYLTLACNVSKKLTVNGTAIN